MNERTSGTPEDATGTPDPETGTPAATQDDGSAGNQDGGSAHGDGGSDAGSAEDYKSLWEKSERERLRLLTERTSRDAAVEAAIQAERARGQSPPTSDPRAALDQHMANLRVMAESQDEGVRTLAQTSLALLQVQGQNSAEMQFQAALLQVDSDIRSDVEAMVRDRKADIPTAVEIVKLRRSQASTETQRKQVAERDLAAQTKKDTAPSTGAANAGPAPRRHTTMTFSEREKLQERASPAEWSAHMADVDEGRVKLVPG